MRSSVSCVSVLIGTISMWIMWACTYMHQMNPLIEPILMVKKDWRWYLWKLFSLHRGLINAYNMEWSDVDFYVFLKGLQVVAQQLLQALHEVLVVGAIGAVQVEEKVSQVFLNYGKSTLSENFVELSFRKIRSSSVVSSHSSPSS